MMNCCKKLCKGQYDCRQVFGIKCIFLDYSHNLNSSSIFWVTFKFSYFLLDYRGESVRFMKNNLTFILFKNHLRENYWVTLRLGGRGGSNSVSVHFLTVNHGQTSSYNFECCLQRTAIYLLLISPFQKVITSFIWISFYNKPPTYIIFIIIVVHFSWIIMFARLAQIIIPPHLPRNI